MKYIEYAKTTFVAILAMLTNIYNALVSAFGTKGGAASPILGMHEQLRYIGENIGSKVQVIQACNDSTAFTAVLDASDLVNSVNHVTGSVAVEWDKDGVPGADVLSGIQDTIAAQDLSSFLANDYMMVASYIPDLTNVVSAHLRVGTDSANYQQWTWLKASMTAASYNLLLAKLSEATVVGNGWNQAVATYVSFVVEFAAAGNLLDAMKCDSIYIMTSEAVKQAFGSQAISNTTTCITLATDDQTRVAIGAAADAAVDGDAAGSQSAKLRGINKVLATISTAIGNIYTSITALLARVPVIQATHTSPMDGTVTYASNVTLDCAGWPFTVDTAANTCRISYLKYKPTAGSWTTLVNGAGGVSMSAAANVITVTGAGTPFAVGDLYELGLIYQDKAFVAATNEKRVVVTNDPVYTDTEDDVADTTNQAISTVNYPSADGLPMADDGKHHITLIGKLISVGLCTGEMRVQGTNDEDLTTADWITANCYDVKNDCVRNVWTLAAGATLTFWIACLDVRVKYIRVQVIIAGAATNTIIIKAVRSA